MTKTVSPIARRYRDLATRTLDDLQKCGDVRIFEVGDTDGLRAAIRREAGRRKVRVHTRGVPERHFVLAIAESVRRC